MPSEWDLPLQSKHAGRMHCPFVPALWLLVHLIMGTSADQGALLWFLQELYYSTTRVGWLHTLPTLWIPDSTCLFLHLFHQVRRAVIAPSCQPFCTPSFLLGPHCGLNVCVPLQIQMLKPLLHAGGIWGLWRCSDHEGNSQHAWD